MIIAVSVGIITDTRNRILITRRANHVSHAGFWEFPGGKIEPSETPEQALIREMKEEVNLSVMQYQFLGEVTHSYADRAVHLSVFHVNEFQGTPICGDAQTDLKWVFQSELANYSFPAANQGIMNFINGIGVE